MNIRTSSLATFVALSLAACGSPAPDAPASSPAPSPVPAAESNVAGWAGRWTGPEGTYLDVTRAGDGTYTVEIANLDGPRRFSARDAGDRLEFVRDGQVLSLRATDGAGTGMKWLADREDCLVVVPGEGYCR